MASITVNFLLVDHDFQYREKYLRKYKLMPANDQSDNRDGISLSPAYLSVQNFIGQKGVFAFI